MSLYRPKGSKTWYMSFMRKDGSRERRTTGTVIKRKAQELHDRLKNESWDIDNTNQKPDYLWEEAVIRYSKEKQNIKSQVFMAVGFQCLDKYLRGIKLKDIDVDLLDHIKWSRLEETYQRCADGKKYNIASSTANKTLEQIRTVLLCAKNIWHWIDNIPTFNFVEMRPGEGESYSWLTHNEAAQVLKELPLHLQRMVRFSLATGIRKSNLTGLKWQKVYLDKKFAYVDPIESKNKKAIRIPLNDDAISILMEVKGDHEVNVFTYNGRPIKDSNTAAWRKALDRAGIRPYFPNPSAMTNKYPSRELDEYKYKDFRWHDLRHTWASWHAHSGTSLAVLQELGGWRSFGMVLRYAHLCDRHIDKFANNIQIDSDE